MSTRISTNLDSLRGLLNLQKANALQSQALERLSTGTQLNSAADNPSGLIASNSLGLQISAINQSITNSNLASNVIGTADSALASVDTLLNQIRGLVQQGVNSGAQSGAQIQADQSQIDAALSAINRISSNTQFAGENLLDGSKSFNTQQTAGDAAKLSNFSINQALFGSASTITVDSSVVTAATQGQLTYNGGNLSAATTLQVSGAKGSQVLFFGAGSSYTNIKDAINANTDATGVSASITTAAVASTYTLTGANGDGTLTSAGSNNDVHFQGNKNATVTFVVSGNNTARSISVSGNAITVNVATDANGNVANTETANAISTAINGNGGAAALVTASAGAGVEGDGSGLVAAHASFALTDNSDLTFTDARQNAGASDPAVSVNFVTSGNNTARSISITGNAVTVNLATDANGNVASTETASAIAAAIAGNSQASSLVTATAAGDGAGQVGSSSGAQNLTGGVNGVLTLTSTDYGSDQTVGISVLKGSFQTYDSSNTATYRSVGTDIVARINGQTATGKGLTASVTTSLLDASVTFAAASNLANVDSKITITGGGSLFQIGEDVSTAGQIGVGIDSVNTAHLGGSAGKLYQLGSGAGKSLTDVGQNGVTGGNLVDIINQALSQVDTLRARLGAIQSDVIQTNVDSLGVALQNITDAKSQISDTDFAKTTAQLTQSQILSQAGISVLQIANQAPQQVLKLLG
jgi:flagellin